MSRILAIALDAAEPSLLERWMEDGSLPNLAALRARGRYGRLASTSDWMTGSTWPSFYTGQNPANHGFYNYLVWNPDAMVTEPASQERLPLRPFWRSFKDAAGPRAIVIDIPLTYAPEPFHGMEITSLATHDSLVPMTGFPSNFVDSIRARMGEQIMSNERYGLQDKREFRETRDDVVHIIEKVAALCVELVKSEPWDFFLTSFASIHRGGHRLWALHNIEEPLTSAERTEFSDALRQVYIACDRAIGQLVEAAGDRTTVLVFSLQGMRDNTSRNIVLPEMLQRVLHDQTSEQLLLKPSLLSRLRTLIPLEWRHRVKTALPVGLRHRLTAFWRFRSIDWKSTTAFSMVADAQGWIRINLKGREKDGIVEPGAEFDELCEKIARGLKTFVDADTNEPLIRNLVRTSQVFEGDKLRLLPDLIIQWSTQPAHRHRVITSPHYGSIAWPTPGRNPEGRSGNHFPEGMLIAAGGDFKSGTINDAHILDLAPTILTLLGQPIPSDLEGRALFNS